MTHHANPTTAVAIDLSAIVSLTESLEEQAVNDSNDHLMPGGLAMVALGPVANLESWGHRLDAAERHALEFGLTVAVEDDDDWEPPLQTLLFWSEDLRREHGQEFEPTPHRPRPTVASEANIVRHYIEWLWENEPRFEDFAKDVRDARSRLESLLAEGLRAQRGVPCLSIECENGTLSRPVADRREHHHCDGHDGVCVLPHAHCPHDRGGLRDEWVCSVCPRTYNTEDYLRAVAQVAFLNAEWLPMEDVTRRTGAKRGSILGWAARGHVRRRKDVQTGRTLYHVGDTDTRTNEGLAS